MQKVNAASPIPPKGVPSVPPTQWQKPAQKTCTGIAQERSASLGVCPQWTYAGPDKRYINSKKSKKSTHRFHISSHRSSCSLLITITFFLFQNYSSLEITLLLYCSILIM